MGRERRSKIEGARKGKRDRRKRKRAREKEQRREQDGTSKNDTGEEEKQERWSRRGRVKKGA